jgi:hypothetical protein
MALQQLPELGFDPHTRIVDMEPRPALAEFGISVRVPPIVRREDVTVRVDDVVRARHRQSLPKPVEPVRIVPQASQGREEPDASSRGMA